MSLTKNTPSNARFALVSLTAAAVFYSPLAVYAGSSAADARAAVQRSLALQGSTSVGGSNLASTSGSQAGLLTAQAQAQISQNNARRESLVALQSAARAAALAAASSVPNGLVPGGLEVATGATVSSGLWSGATLPVQENTSGQFKVTIRQTSPQALLTWNSFNVGRETSLKFDQSKPDWVAFNKITDPSGDPSRILGSIDALGQVYIINPNGIIFGGSAQVNTRTLVASSLPINDGLVSRGLLNNPDTQFLFSGLKISAGSETGEFIPPTPARPDGHYGDVLVEAGAILNSPTNADKSGGRVALIGANVSNSGTISTPDGQTILAAGLQVGMEGSSDASLRGLSVSVGQVGEYAGKTVNSGVISSNRGAVTAVGKNIEQNGLIDSTTSVSRNGRIDLLGQYEAIEVGNYANLPDFFATKTGMLSFGANSVTEILPEISSNEKVSGTKLALNSQINARGLVVHMQEDASILAPSADVSISAGRWNILQLGTNQANAQFVYTDGQVYFEKGATINVSGTTGAKGSVADNIVEASLRGDELANSPLQRDGLLRGQTISVDILKTGTYNGKTWVGTPLADVTGYINLVQRDVGQLTTVGGNVKINAGGSVVFNLGAMIDVSGGFVDFESAKVSTTKVIYQGSIIDISKATPDLVYDGIYDGVGSKLTNVLKWGGEAANSLKSSNRLLTEETVQGYIQGGDAGSLSIGAPSMILDGTLIGHSVSGIRQRTTPAKTGSLSLNLVGQYADARVSDGYLTDSRSAPVLYISNKLILPSADKFELDVNGLPIALKEDRLSTIVLSPDLVTSSGFGRLFIDNREGDVIIDDSAELSLPVLGELSLFGKNININANVTAPGGKLNFVATAVSQGSINEASITASSPENSINRGSVNVSPNVRISAAGNLENENVGTVEDPIILTGGSVVVTGYNVNFENGTTIDVSGGVYAATGNKFSYGNGGSISINSGQDPNIKNVIGGILHLNQTKLQGYSGVKGGVLSLLAPAIQVGSGASESNTTILDSDFFRTGGFTTFEIKGLGSILSADEEIFSPGILIKTGTIVNPVSSSYVAEIDDAQPEKLGFAIQLLDQSFRPPTNITFTAPGVRDPYNGGRPILIRGDVIVEPGASVQTDPGGKISINGDTVDVQGSLIAQGGAITLKGSSNSNVIFPFTNNNQPIQTVTLGSTAILNSSGTTVFQPDTTYRNLRIGKVFPGGSINLSGNIQAASGSILDVSGTTAIIDIDPAYSGQLNPIGIDFVPTQIDSSAGSLTLTGAQQLIVNSTLRGIAGGPSSEGGKLSISTGIYVPVVGPALTSRDVNLIVTQSPTLKPDLTRGNFAVDSLNNSGFDSVNLGGTVQFSGPVFLGTARELFVGSNGVIFGDDKISLNAPRVSIGTSLQKPRLTDLDDTRAFYDNNNLPLSIAPTHGEAQLNVNASSLIEVGNLSLQGVGSLFLNNEMGDIRGSGTLDISGDILLKASQVYPPTSTIFSINAYDYDFLGSYHAGSITVEKGSGFKAFPYSAGGTLNINASSIRQNGVLKAPLGIINLGWNGSGSAPVDQITGFAIPIATTISLGSNSLTSVSAVDPTDGNPIILPYGVNVNGSSWVNPEGRDITNFGPPTKKVVVSALSLTSEAGSIVDVNGGGDLVASRFKTGTGGKVDILADVSSFAILPNYKADFAPYAAFNDSANAKQLLGEDEGYVNNTLKTGDRIYLDSGSGLSAGYYTLLPARYGVLPGAFLVTPKSSTPLATAAVQPDNSVFVSGYRFNDSGGYLDKTPLRSMFEVASSSVIQNRATYDNAYASTFFRDNAMQRATSIPRLPADAGQMILSATEYMEFDGSILARSGINGLGGRVDIDSPVNIVISGPRSATLSDELVLDSSKLSAFSGASLLIGGVRQTTSEGTQVSVGTNSLTVDNAGAPLTGSELILVAKENLTIKSGSEILQSGELGGAADSLVIGGSKSGLGDGVLVRVSSDSSATVKRLGVSSSNALLNIASNTSIQGGASLIFDSTGSTQIASSASFGADSLALNSGRISLQLNDSGDLQSNPGLVLSTSTLDSLQSSSSRLSLFSYSSVDLYGIGQVGSASFSQLTIGAPTIRGFNNAGGDVSFIADTIELNGGVGVSGVDGGTSLGSLSFTARDIKLAAGDLAIHQFKQLNIHASEQMVFNGVGKLETEADIAIDVPVITAQLASAQNIISGGALSINGSGESPISASPGGLGAQLNLTGKTLSVDSSILLPSGRLFLNSTGGDIKIGTDALALLDVGGISRSIQGATVNTNGGSLSLSAKGGNLVLGDHGILSVSASPSGGDAGEISISADSGKFLTTGSILGSSGNNGKGGGFSADIGSLVGSSLGSVDDSLNSGGFNLFRKYRIRSGDVKFQSRVSVSNYEVSVDDGDIEVSGVIDASGITGGSIRFSSSGNMTILNGSRLDVSAQQFSNAGKGGSIRLEAGASSLGAVDSSASLTLCSGSTIDLSVKASQPDLDSSLGHASGVLFLRAPRNAAGTDLALNPIQASIIGASAVLIEGFKVHDLTPSLGTTASINLSERNAALFDATIFGDASATILNRISGEANRDLLHIQPGLEFVNLTGDIVLDGIWDLSSTRFGSGLNNSDREPGILSIRAEGNIILPYKDKGSASLSDGFGTGVNSLVTTTSLWNAPLLPVGSRSWSFNLTSGSDLSSASVQGVLYKDKQNLSNGSLILGMGAPDFTNVIDTRQSNDGIPKYFQVIRTGSGNINLTARGDIEFRNNLVTVYTSGIQAEEIDDFDVPNVGYNISATSLGARQYSSTPYPAQYSKLGGDVNLFAQNKIFRTIEGRPDSSKQMPGNWLSRRGNIEESSGDFSAYANSGSSGPKTQRNSTSWWVDYNNFFEGVGALGGGNISIIAGSEIFNIDAVVPTNSRMPYGRPNASKLIELGGGNINLTSGGTISGGVYYVENGDAVLSADSDIKTNFTRTTLKASSYSTSAETPESSWLPTTLFVGKGTVKVLAGDDITLGSISNPFLLPGGINNSYFLKSYFSTYTSDTSATIFSLTGDVNLRSHSVSATSGSLYDWYNNVLRRDVVLTTSTLAGRNQPWLRLYETDLIPFSTVSTLMPGSFSVTSASADVNLVGEFNFIPSSQGGLKIIASDSINGLQVLQRNSVSGLNEWASAVINFSDADPLRLPSITSPLSLSFSNLQNSDIANFTSRNAPDTSVVNSLFAESGSYTGDIYGRIQTKQNLHSSNSVHSLSKDPVLFVAGAGDISGFTLYSAQVTEISAARDVSDVGIYIQNLNVNDISTVTAGRDILLYNPDSALRISAQAEGNRLLATNSRSPGPGTGNPNAGDLQIGGSGTLIVKAGRNIDFGETLPLDDGASGGLKSPGDGTAVGLSSIGNVRNLGLPEAGADVVVGVGLGDGSAMNRQAFEAKFLDPASAGTNAPRYLPALAGKLGLSANNTDAIWAAYSALSQVERYPLMLMAFNRVLRDAGRDHGNPESDGFGNYQAGYDAISALFPGSSWRGDLRISSRELRTSAGGDIVVFAPGGGINLGSEISKTQTPPGIITERGGAISLFTHDDVDIGTQRIFTLRGGDILIWSTVGDIAAGSSSTTIQSASPTRVLVDPQTGDVKTDLAGLATGGGIGVLAAVEGVKAGDVDLIAPVGTIDAGDAGIRSAGNINISALTVLNAANISAGGVTSGAPTVVAPNIAGLSVASTASAAASSSAAASTQAAGNQAAPVSLPSFITLEVMGYGGGDSKKDDEDRNQAGGA